MIARAGAVEVLMLPKGSAYAVASNRLSYVFVCVVCVYGVPTGHM